ncbi:MAG: leucine-rich repeat domain-containing protein [Clostridiales bacterium]|nr:leucine-rich repeat domain-containing protein [Clostridiales bacterium]
MSKLRLRLATVFMTVIFVLSLSPAMVSFADTVTSGECGDNLTWSFSGRVLRISGYGDMYDWKNEADVPWSVLRESIAFVRFPDGLTSIGDHAFYNCNNLNDFDLPDTLSYIGSAAFYGCESITEVDIPYGASSIGYCAFQRCKSLKVIDMPETVIKIGYGAFRECESLLKLNIPNGVSTIAQDTFAGCKSLYSINFPDNLTVIGSYAFDDCPNLTAIWLPEAVTYIGTNPFSGCDGLKDIYYAGSRAQFVKIEGYTEIDESITIHYAKKSPLEITKQPADYTGPVGSTASFSVGAQGDGLSYQWQMYSNGAWKNSNASGAKTSKISFKVTSSHNGMKYRCLITDCYGQKVTTNEVYVKVAVSLAITKQPVNYEGVLGSTASFSVTAQGEGLSYQWQVYSGGAWKNSNATGAKTAKISFKVTSSHNGMRYRCIVTDKYGQKVISNPASVRIITSLLITKQPVDYSGPVGSTASFSVTAKGEGLTYQWQVYSGGTWKNSNANGAKTSKISFKVSNSHNGMKYRCVVTDKHGQKVTSYSASVRTS